MVPSGRGMSATMNKRKGVISGMLLVKVYAMDFFRLSNISRPKKYKHVYYIIFLNLYSAAVKI